MADQAGIPIGLGHLAANRMIVGEFDGWLIEHVLRLSRQNDLNVVRKPCTSYSEPSSRSSNRMA